MKFSMVRTVARRTARLGAAAGWLAALAAMLPVAPAHAQWGGNDVRWVDCADEGGVCRTGASNVSVRFGADGRYAWSTVSGDVMCDVSTFGDPAPGRRKRCEMQVATTARPDLMPAPGRGGRWRACANEGGVCRVGNVDATVRFGADGRYEWRTVRGDVACDTRTFGDPAPGVPKRCEVQGAGRPVVGSPSYGGSGWRPCADEGGSCAAAPGAAVRFGADGRYATATAGWGAAASVPCTTGHFGDPAPGRRKVCEVQDGSGSAVGGGVPGGWTACAREGQTCRVPSGYARVRYGSAGRYVERDVSGAIACTNASFGRDPAPGRTKGCEFAAGGFSGPAAAPGWGGSEPGWTRCAEENAYCNVRSGVQARFGVPGRFMDRYFTERFACNAAEFGGDPAPGERKVCEIAGPSSLLR